MDWAALGVGGAVMAEPRRLAAAYAALALPAPWHEGDDRFSDRRIWRTTHARVEAILRGRSIAIVRRSTGESVTTSAPALAQPVLDAVAALASGAR